MDSADVVIAGAGNAGLCAAIAAARTRKRVLVLEAAPREMRGGNSSLTMNMRFPHQSIDELKALVDGAEPSEFDLLEEFYSPYTSPTFAEDLLRASHGRAQRNLVQELTRHSYHTVRWLRSMQHKWEVKPRKLQMRSSVPIRLLGGGRALQERHFVNAEALGVQFLYGSRICEIQAKGARVEGISVECGGQHFGVACRALVMATGGFQASPHLRAEHLGEMWRKAYLRGIPHNDGQGLQVALGIGAAATGDFSACHATPQRAGLPAYILPGENDESQANSRYSFHCGITVNRHGRRFIDEGGDHPNFLYAVMGAAIQSQPQQIAFQVFDARGAKSLSRNYLSGGEMRRSHNLKELARSFGIDPDGLEEEVRRFNAGAKEPARLSPARSAWYECISTPPFYIAPVRAGLTFTYGGLRIDSDARVACQAGGYFDNLYACGEIVGGLFYGIYPGGSGMMAGAHFGRIAGTYAALH